MYLVEIIQPDLYGIFSVIPSIFYNAATLIYSSIQQHFTYTHIAFFAAALHAIFFVLTFFFNESPPWLARGAKKLKRKEIVGKRAQKKDNEQSEKCSEVEIDIGDTPTTIVEWTTANDETVESGKGQTVDIAAIPTLDEIEETMEEAEELGILAKATEKSILDLIKIPKFSLASNINPLVVVLQLMFLANFCGMST